MRGAPAAAAPRCTLLLFRHLQKTGGVSLRHVMHRLELSRDWLNYAEERSNLTLTRTRTRTPTRTRTRTPTRTLTLTLTLTLTRTPPRSSSTGCTSSGTSGTGSRTGCMVPHA